LDAEFVYPKRESLVGHFPGVDSPVPVSLDGRNLALDALLSVGSTSVSASN